MLIVQFNPQSPITFSHKAHATKTITDVVKKDCFSRIDKFEKQFNGYYIAEIFPDLKKYIAMGKIKESEIKSILNNGGLSLIFNTGDDTVLKCSLENPLEFRKHNPNFDIPFLSPVEQVGKVFFVKEAKADTKDITTKDCEEVIKKIKAAGYEPSKDFDKYRPWQVGRYNGICYLLDTRCAIPRPNLFSRFVYDFCERHKRIIEIQRLEPEDILKMEKEEEELIEKFGPKVIHIDETPRKNLTFSEGIKMMIDTICKNFIVIFGRSK